MRAPAHLRLSWLIPLAVALLLAVVGACAPAAEPPESTTEAPSAAAASLQPLEVTDDLGRTLALTRPPQRIASLSAGHTEVLFAIGAGGQVAAVDLFSDYPPETATRTRIDAFQFNPEAVAAAQPDLVLLTYDPGGAVEALERLNIPVLFVKVPASIEGVLASILLLGQVTGHEGEAGELVAETRARIEAVREKARRSGPGPRVFHELDATLYTASAKSFVGDLYAILGAENIAADASQEYPQLSQEVVIARDPEVIILADEAQGESAETVAARPGWAGVSAVRNGRVYTVNPDLVSRPGPRLVEALEALAALLYPNAFPVGSGTSPGY